MAIAKSERFKSEGVDIVLKGMPTEPFPPEKFRFRDRKLFLLGKSNRDNLYPPSIEDTDMIKAMSEGKIGQFVYSDEDANIYDVLFYIDTVEQLVIHSIMTRLQ